MSARMSDRPAIRRLDRVALVVSAVVLVAFVVASASGCFKRWPIVVTGGGSGTGEGHTVRK